MTSDDVPGFLVDGATQNLTCAGGEISVLYSFSDVCGTASIACSVTVLAGAAPVIICPEIEEIEFCDQEEFEAPLAEVILSCGGLTIVEGELDSIVSCNGTAVDVIYSFGDACGFTEVACSASVIPIEEGPEIIECPESFQVVSIPLIMGGGGTGSGTGSGTVPPVPQPLCESIAVTWDVPSAEADCGEVSLESNIEPGSLFETGFTTVIYTATDICGNTSVCSFDVQVTCDETFDDGDEIVAARSSEEIIVSFEKAIVEETEIVSENTLETKVYPNPVSSILTIEVTTGERLPMEFEIYDFLGSKITSSDTRTLDAGVNQIEIPVADIQSGTYILIMKLGEEIRSERISVFR